MSSVIPVRKTAKPGTPVSACDSPCTIEARSASGGPQHTVGLTPAGSFAKTFFNITSIATSTKPIMKLLLNKKPSRIDRPTHSKDAALMPPQSASEPDGYL